MLVLAWCAFRANLRVQQPRQIWMIYIPERIANVFVGYNIHNRSRDHSVMEFREK
jgi:hypothetical protein